MNTLLYIYLLHFSLTSAIARFYYLAIYKHRSYMVRNQCSYIQHVRFVKVIWNFNARNSHFTIQFKI